MKIWMTVTPDIYEFPVLMSDTARGLAEQAGVTTMAIVSAISHARSRGARADARGRKTLYECVDVDEDDEFEDLEVRA